MKHRLLINSSNVYSPQASEGFPLIYEEDFTEIPKIQNSENRLTTDIPSLGPAFSRVRLLSSAVIQCILLLLSLLDAVLPSELHRSQADIWPTGTAGRSSWPRPSSSSDRLQRSRLYRRPGLIALCQALSPVGSPSAWPRASSCRLLTLY